MRYAWIENGVVVNLSEGIPVGAEGTVCVQDRPVAMGDAYTDGVFTRDGSEVRTLAEENAVLREALSQIEEALNG